MRPAEDHVCLLDCIALDLQEMDIFTAERLPCQLWEGGSNPPESPDLIFPSYSVHRTGDNLLKDRCRLKLKVERNLDKYGVLQKIKVVKVSNHNLTNVPPPPVFPLLLFKQCYCFEFEFS